MPLLLLVAGFLTLSHLAPFEMPLDGSWGGARLVWRMPHADGRRIVYLTFDDGPNPAATPELLDVLRAEGVPATFFVIDRHLTPETVPIVRRMFDEGHAVGIHWHSRRLMASAPDTTAAAIAGAAVHLQEATRRLPCRAFRPHGGGRSGEMYVALARLDYALVGWSFSLWDFAWFGRRDPGRIADRIASRASPGAIVVMHDGHHENPRADRRDIEATRALIPRLRAAGFSFGRICGEDGRVPPDDGVAGP